MNRLTAIAAAAGLAASTGLAAPAAQAQEDHFQTNLGGRFRLMEVYQAERNLNVGSQRLNVLFDALTGRSWVLRYDRDPKTNRNAYVWVEIPMIPPPPE